MTALAIDVRELDSEEIDAVSGGEFGCAFTETTTTTTNPDGSTTTTTTKKWECYGGRETEAQAQP